MPAPVPFADSRLAPSSPAAPPGFNRVEQPPQPADATHAADQAGQAVSNRGAASVPSPLLLATTASSAGLTSRRAR